MYKFKVSQFTGGQTIVWSAGWLVAALLAWVSIATPALAHHAMDGQMPTNFFEGFLTGLAHPLIGVDHFAFIVAIGLLAATRRQGILIPIGFGLAAMVGTGLHLVNVTIPGVELLVAGSIVIFSGLLIAPAKLGTVAITGLAAAAGLCHGYAYGEAIFGAETTPLVAYLIGFTLVQMGVSLAAFRVGKALLARHGEVQASQGLGPAGWLLCGVGLAFLVPQLIEFLLPTPIS
ncbi:MAG: HupE/UreJ family protein [Nodosilinea sp.]